MKLLIIIVLFGLIGILTSCANDKSTGTPTPAYATYYFPVFYPSYYYTPLYDEYYQPGPYNNNFNYYGYYAYWGTNK